MLPSGISGFNSRFIIGLNYHLLKVMILHIGMSGGNAQSLSLRVSAWATSPLVLAVPGKRRGVITLEATQCLSLKAFEL